MGIYTEYINKNLDWPSLEKERKKQLKRISEIRGRAVLTYAAAIGKKANIALTFEDRDPFLDQLSNVDGDEIDVILETPGGFAEIAEDFVKVLRSRFSRVGMIVPGYAKSAGTIMVMSGDEILMEPSSALGPIDAQVVYNSKSNSAEAYLEGFNKIKQEVIDTGTLNKAYIPILQNITPADLQACQNAQDFSKTLVTKWLTEYKFLYWETHKSTGKKVTDSEKLARAEEIAGLLCKHQEWLTHNRSITIQDLRNILRLEIIDYSENPDLYDAIRRYYVLLRMTFDTTAIFKVFETPKSQIYKHEIDKSPVPKDLNNAIVEFKCNKCGFLSKMQANFKKGIPLEKETIPFPKDNKFICPQCGQEHDVMGLRRHVESQTKKKILEG